MAIRKVRTVIPVTIALAVVFMVVTLGADKRQAAEPDYEDLARNLVELSANIEEGEMVYISGDVRDIELLENIAVHVRKKGAFPLLTIESDRLTRRMYTDVPPQYDTQTPELALKITGLLDAFISVESGDNEALLADIPPERFAARGKAFEPVSRLMRERGVRMVNLGNELYPTETRASRYGISKDQLAEIFWNGVNVDYGKLEAQGKAVQQILSAGKELHITNPNGTDLRVQIGTFPVLVSDGIISEEDEAKGGAATMVWLPAGEVYAAVVPGTAEGTVVVDRQSFQGKEIKNLRLSFSGGKLTKMTADEGLEPLQAYYDAAGDGKDQFAAVDVGINPSVMVPPGSKLEAWMAAGMVTVGFGGNTWAGGDNTVAFGMANHLPGSTLTVDGKVLVEKGQLRVPTM